MKTMVYFVLLGAVFSFSAAFAQESSADLILLNGKVFTADLDTPSAEAVAIRGERILAVGSSDEIKRLANAKTRLLDLQGRTVIPGINDAHFHFMPDPQGYRLQLKSQEPSWSETLEAVKSAVSQTPKGQWIFGEIGNRVLSEQEADRFALDRIAPEHPVLLRSYFGHGYIVNSRGMPLLQLVEEEPDPVGGHFERVGSSKQINGRFWAYAEWKPNRILVNQVSDAEAIEALRELTDEAARFGITSMQIMSSMSVDRFARLLVEADLPVRVRAMPFALTSPNGRDLSEFQMFSQLSFPNSKVTVSGIKWILDGTPFERGAALREPYNDRPDWRGRLLFPESEISEMVKESLRFNQQILFHCAGDQAVEAVFDALERTGGGNIDWREKRVRIEHGDGVSGDLIERAKRLGVVIVQNPTHFSLVDMIYARYSPDTKFFTARSLIEAGIPFALGSDGPMNPFLNIMLAAIHPARPGEAITREQAIRAYTFGSAYAEFAETEKGTLTKGKFADLAVLSQDILTVPVPELPATQSLLTIVSGKIVYDAAVLR
jgi:predicted amidohydrolase YtcJ